jgi:multidrug efflux pump subunit AcrA (membrane-fusion protein)
VTEVLAKEGDLVRVGQPILRLTSVTAEEEQAVHRVERDRFETAARGAREASDPALVFDAERRRDSAEAALQSDAARGEQLVVRSPISGRVLTPRLADLRGAAVSAGTLLVEVGDTRTLRADLGVSERLFEDLRPGDPVQAMLPGRPLDSARGTIQSVSSATFEQSPTARTEREPPPPGLYPDKFIAVAVFDNRDGSLVPGMAGRAKVFAKRTSPASNAWHILRRWLQTIFW